jgi:hypothetical protein
MASRCSICNSEHFAAIDDLADSQSLTLKEIAAQFQVSYPALVRHAARHSKNAPAPTPENGTSDLAAEAAKWMRRADRIYETSTANDDVRGAAQSLQVAFRGLELQHKAELKAAEVAPPAGETPLTIEYMDSLIEKTLNETERGRNQNRLYSAPDAVLEIACRIADHPEMLGAVETILEGRI